MAINFRKFLCSLAQKGNWLYKICDCKRYETPEQPTVTVRLCMDSFFLANEYCPNTEFRQFNSGYEPKIFCSLHKASEYIWLYVCLHSGLLPNPYCQEVEQKRFEKGNEPTEICGVCKKPRPERTHMPASLELLACFLDFARKGNADFWDNTFKRIHDELKIERVTFFPYAIEENGLYNYIIPWLKSGNKFDLSRHNEIYWEQLTMFAKIAADNGVLLIPVLFPGFYGEAPFRHNINSISDEWSIEARQYQVTYMRRLLMILRDAYKDTCWGGNS